MYAFAFRGIRTIDDLQNYDYPISQHEEYQKAVRFAGSKEKQQYDLLNTSLLERYKSMMSSRRAEIEELNNKIISDKKIGNDNRVYISRLKAKETILLMILIILIILDVINVILIFTASPFAIIFLVILGIPAFFVLRSLIRTKKRIKEVANDNINLFRCIMDNEGKIKTLQREYNDANIGIDLK